MASKTFDLKVAAVDMNSGFATLIDADEIDDVVKYELFMPAHFGGHTNPYPKTGEVFRVRYGMSRNGPGILQCWREEEATV